MLRWSLSFTLYMFYCWYLPAYLFNNEYSTYIDRVISAHVISVLIIFAGYLIFKLKNKLVNKNAR